MERFDRQQFLGAQSDAVFQALTVGLVGLGGGGSHHVQQLAHLGIGGFVLVDPDTIDLTNTNRLIGGTLEDVAAERSKVAIAERIIRGLNPSARVVAVDTGWEHALEALKGCDVIMGAVDTYGTRDQLEKFCRRFLIPYIDIGMDIRDLDEHGYLISGQVFLSSPGRPCLWCCGFLTQEKLTLEANRYGAGGGRPQVVWPNGVLASTAVGLLVQLVTPWHDSGDDFAYLAYDGNRHTMIPHPWAKVGANLPCPHFEADEVGDPGFDVRKPSAIPADVKLKEAAPATVSPGAVARFCRWARRASGRLGRS